MSIKCAIVDDEPMAAKGIAGYASKISVLEVVGVYHSALELNESLKSASIDLVFLDIEMPYLTGINWLKTVKNPPGIIFTTAYDRFALEGFELDVIDYLLKPVSFERFLKAVNKAEAQLQKAEDYIYIKSEGKLEKLRYEEILYVESMQNYVIFHQTDQKLISHLTMKTVEEQLPGKLFIRTHKSFLINKSHVKSIEGARIALANGAVIPISKTQKEEVLQKLTEHKILKK